MNNFEARNGNFETSAVVKNQRVIQREQKKSRRLLAMESEQVVFKRRQLQLPTRDKGKRAKSTQPNPTPGSSTQQSVKNASRTKSPRGRRPSVKVARLPCKDCLKGTCTTPFCEKWHPPECLFYKSEKGCRFWDKCSYEHRQVDEQPSKKSQKNGDRIAVAILKNTRQLGCVF